MTDLSGSLEFTGLLRNSTDLQALSVKSSADSFSHTAACMHPYQATTIISPLTSAQGKDLLIKYILYIRLSLFG